MKTHMGSGLRPMIIISSTSISRSQPAFVLEVEIKEDNLRKGKAREVASGVFQRVDFLSF